MRPSGTTTLSIGNQLNDNEHIVLHFNTRLNIYTVILKFVWLSVTMKNAIIFSVVMLTALRNFPIRNNPERNIPECNNPERNNPETLNVKIPKL